MLRRTLPIWSSDQPIDHAGIAKTFVGATRPFVGPATFLARTVVDVPTNAQRRVARLTTDGKYQLHVNGDRVARGPVRCDPLFQRYDVIDLTPRLLPGHNVISLIIRVEGRDTAQYQRVRGHWLETFGDGALWFELEFDDQIVPITPEQWRFSQFDAWPRGTPVGNLSLGHLETFDANLLPERWQTLEFDDAEWFPGQALISGGGGPEANFGGMSITAFPTLLPRTGSVPIEADLSPVEIVWVATGAPTTLPFEQAIYEERLEPLAGDAVKVVCEALADAAWPVTEPDTSILVRFERVHAGRPFIELTASGGEIVDIAAVESLPGEFTGALADFARARPHPTIHGSDANVARFVARAGRQRLEKYAWVGTRYLQIAIRGATPATVVHAIGSREEYQDWRETGTLETDDPFWNWLWRTGVATIRACAIDTWIDCPTREQRQWLGDVAVEFPAAWAAFGDACTPLNQQFLEQAAESQRPDGLLQMFAPGDHGVNAVLIPDWTLQWIGVLHDHFMRTGDVEILRLLPTARRALDWFERHAESSGLLRDLPFWTFFDWAGVGREHQATAPNALFAGALAQYANLSDYAGNSGDADRARSRSVHLGIALHRTAFDAERGVYVDMVLPGGEQLPRVSQHANSLMIRHGLAPTDKWSTILAYISDPKRLRATAAPRVVPEGEELDPGTDCVKASTFFSHFVADAFLKAGRADLAFRQLRELFEPMRTLGATTLWEAHRPSASLCHGFSATGLHQMTAGAFGIEAAEPGYRRLRIRPQPLTDLGNVAVCYPLGDRTLTLRHDLVANGAIVSVYDPSSAMIEVSPTPEIVVRSIAPSKWHVSRA